LVDDGDLVTDKFRFSRESQFSHDLKYFRKRGRAANLDMIVSLLFMGNPAGNVSDVGRSSGDIFSSRALGLTATRSSAATSIGDDVSKSPDGGAGYGDVW